MLIYLILILIVGLVASKNKSDYEYIFLSRKLTLPSFIATIVTTWYGGILEIGRFTFENGIVTWVIFGFFYYIAALIFLHVFAQNIHRNNINTIPEYFHKYFGYIPGLITSLVILLISSPAPYLMIFAIIFNHIYGTSYIISILIGMFFSISYIIIGGFQAIIRTDKIQFVLMYVGFIIILLALYFEYGGISYLLNNLPKNHLSFVNKLPIGYVLSWSLISMITFIDPNIFQRVYAADNKNTIKKGIYISLIFWIIFDFLTISTGLYAAAIIKPDDLTGNPYLILSEMVLSPYLQTIFIISLLSIVMSTIDSFTFTSAITISREFNNNLSQKNNIAIGLIITCVLSLIISYYFTSVIDIWYIFGSIGASSILIPLIKLLNAPKKRIFYPTFTVILPILVCLIWIYAGNPYGVDCMYPGIISSLCINYNS